MITENDLTISNKSYINKDFASMYNEVVEIAKKISYKYDPTTSNESDPFIVLIKLLCFVGDKLNYNIDKNVLERFMPSATQDTSMRELCEMLGYNPNYYISPEVELFIKYVGSEEFTSAHTSFTLPRLSTSISTYDKDIQYVLTENCVISGKDRVQDIAVKAIQGVLKTLSISGSEVIHLDNIDENNRVYFPETTVAQNGVFIAGGTVDVDTEWERVYNLNILENNKFVYKFGFDSSRNFPYIEFSKDIALIIGDGLKIQYVSTKGTNGAISKNALYYVDAPEITWDNSTDTISFENENDERVLVPINSNSSTPGSMPESINESYNGFKKTIGTFETLVTCRDYANYIYSSLYDSNGNHLVSNAQVGDRRTDINYSNPIVSYSSYGPFTYNGANASNITPYDLCIYALNSMGEATIDTYNNSFKPKSDISSIESELEELRCISHNYKDLEATDIFNVKNYLRLTAKVATNAKVSDIERRAIIENIRNALVKNFNAREVDYGYEIPYDELLNTITSSDERIKAVSLYEPDLTTKFMVASGNEYDLTSNDGRPFFLFTVARNILSGKIDMFDYDDEFAFAFGQQTVDATNSGVKDDIQKVTTDAKIQASTTGYTLNPNERIQVVSPSLVTDVTYPYGINYYLKLATTGMVKIDANTEYELVSGDVCIFEYADSNDNQVVRIYKYVSSSPVIIKPNVDLYTTDYRINTIEGTHYAETPNRKFILDASIREELNNLGVLDSQQRLPLFMLNTNEQVEHRTINKETLSKNAYLYWIMGNSTNTINWNANGEYMLEENEWFFHTNASFNTLSSYGSGTVLKKVGFDASFSWSAKTIEASVLSDGLLSHKEYFKLASMDSATYLEFLEQQIITLAEGDSCETTSGTINVPNAFDNGTLIPASNPNFKYKLSGEDAYTLLQPLSFTSAYYKIRGRLDINITSDSPQILVGNQEMKFYNKTGGTLVATLTANGVNRVCSKYTHQISGGENINIEYIDINDTTQLVPETIFTFTKSNNAPTNIDALNFGRYTNFNANNPIEIDIPNISNRCVSFMMWTKNNSSSSINVICTSYIDDTTAGGTIYEYATNSTTPTTSYTTAIASASEIVHTVCVRGANKVKITTNSTDDMVLIVGSPRLIVTDTNGDLLPNGSLGLQSGEFATLKTKIVDSSIGLDKTHKFNFTHKVDNSKHIEYDDLSSPYAFYDYNNVANKWTISQIDFNTSSIDIARSSLA